MSVLGTSIPWAYLDVPSVTEHATSWNLDVFVAVIKELAPNMDWKEVAGSFDYPEFRVPDTKSLALIFSVFRKAKVTIINDRFILGKLPNCCAV